MLLLKQPLNSQEGAVINIYLSFIVILPLFYLNDFKKKINLFKLNLVVVYFRARTFKNVSEFKDKYSAILSIDVINVNWRRNLLVTVLIILIYSITLSPIEPIRASFM